MTSPSSNNDDARTEDDQSLLSGESVQTEVDRSSLSSENEWTNVKDLILTHISDVRSSGSFATSGLLEKFVLPGIVVEEVGAVGLPLTSHNTERLVRVARQAPFGKGDQTLIDETVRKTWEIDSRKISFSNPSWQGWLDGVVKTVAHELGVAGGVQNVQAELYKMLLYTEGAMFKQHKDTEKTPGMFGTLVICLPSVHVGGAIHLKHGQKEKTFETAEFSDYNITYIAWYADVSHEILPIQSGCRWILVYNLITASISISQSAAGIDAQRALLVQALNKWHSLDEVPGLERSVVFHNDEEREEDVEIQLRLDRVVDIEGFMLGKDLVIPERFLLQESLYDSRDPDNQSGGEYIGNRHEDMHQLYYDIVLLIVRKDLVTDFLLGQPSTLGGFKNFLERLEVCFKMRNKDRYMHELILQTCQKHLKLSYPDGETRDLFLGTVAIAAIIIADQSLFQDAVNSVENGFDSETFFTLGKLVCFEKLVVLEDDLNKAFSKILKLHRVYKCLYEFRKAFSEKNPNCSDEYQAQHIASWVKDQISKALKSLPKAYPQDAAALIKIAIDYDDKMFEECVRPFIARFASNSDFSNALAVELLSFSQSSDHNGDLVPRIFSLVLNPTESHFDLIKYSSAAKGMWSYEDYPYSSWPNCSTDKQKGEHDASNVIGLYQKFLESDGEKASNLLRKIQLQTESFPQTELDRFVIPLLAQMMQIMDLCSSEARWFYQSMMATYITRVVKKEPEKPRDWSRPNEVEPCYIADCLKCKPLLKFLIEPEEESLRIVLPDDSKRHITSSVPKECEKFVDTSQNQPVLIVTKTLKGWEREHTEWQKRASKAQDTLKKLCGESLKRCLAEKYDAIMDLDIVKVPDTASITDNGISSLQNSQPTVGRKRPRSDS